MKQILNATISLEIETDGKVDNQGIVSGMVNSVFQQGTNAQVVAIYDDKPKPTIAFHVSGVTISDVSVEGGK